MIIDEVKMIENWFIMLNTTEFDGNDAGLIRDEMQKFLVDFYKYNVLGINKQKDFAEQNKETIE